MVMQWQRDLPEAQGSTTVKSQCVELYRSKPFGIPHNAASGDYELRVYVTWDDQCGNGSNTFYYREEVVLAHSNRMSERIGLDHAAVVPLLSDIPPETRALAKWNGCHPFGPWYYIENTVYFANDKDCHGLRKGERRQIRNGRTGLPAWNLVAIDADGNEVELHKLPKNPNAEEAPPCPYRLEYRPWCRIGEGKEPDYAAARRVAVWPEATEAQLADPDLTTALKARLPDLLREFRADIERIGFTW